MQYNEYLYDFACWRVVVEGFFYVKIILKILRLYRLNKER